MVKAERGVSPPPQGGGLGNLLNEQMGELQGMGGKGKGSRHVSPPSPTAGPRSSPPRPTNATRPTASTGRKTDTPRDSRRTTSPPRPATTRSSSRDARQSHSPVQSRNTAPTPPRGGGGGGGAARTVSPKSPAPLLTCRPLPLPSGADLSEQSPALPSIRLLPTGAFDIDMKAYYFVKGVAVREMAGCPRVQHIEVDCDVSPVLAEAGADGVFLFHEAVVCRRVRVVIPSMDARPNAPPQYSVAPLLSEGTAKLAREVMSLQAEVAQMKKEQRAQQDAANHTGLHSAASVDYTHHLEGANQERDRPNWVDKMSPQRPFVAGGGGGGGGGGGSIAEGLAANGGGTVSPGIPGMRTPNRGIEVGPALRGGGGVEQILRERVMYSDLQLGRF